MGVRKVWGVEIPMEDTEAVLIAGAGLATAIWGLHRRTRKAIGTHSEQKRASREPLEG